MARRYGFSDPTVAFRIFIRSVHSRFAQDVARLNPQNLGQACDALRKAEEINRLPPSSGIGQVNVFSEPLRTAVNHVRDEHRHSQHPDSASQAVSTLIRAADANNAALRQSMGEMIAQCNDTFRASLNVNGDAHQTNNLPFVCPFCLKPNHTFDNCFARLTIERIKQGTDSSQSDGVPRRNRNPRTRNQAPARTNHHLVRCSYCSKPGHSVVTCFKRARDETNAQSRDTYAQPDTGAPYPDTAKWHPRQRTQKFYPGRNARQQHHASVNAITFKNRTPVIKIPVRVGYIKSSMLWDTGAEASVVDAGFVQSCKACT